MKLRFGRNETNLIFLGAMYEEGLLENDALDRYNVKANVDHRI